MDVPLKHLKIWRQSTCIPIAPNCITKSLLEFYASDTLKHASFGKSNVKSHAT